MRIIISTPQGKFVVNLPNSKIYEFGINEYSEEIMECYK